MEFYVRGLFHPDLFLELGQRFDTLLGELLAVFLYHGFRSVWITFLEGFEIVPDESVHVTLFLVSIHLVEADEDAGFDGVSKFVVDA